MINIVYLIIAVVVVAWMSKNIDFITSLFKKIQRKISYLRLRRQVTKILLQSSKALQKNKELREKGILIQFNKKKYTWEGTHLPKK